MLASPDMPAPIPYPSPLWGHEEVQQGGWRECATVGRGERDSPPNGDGKVEDGQHSQSPLHREEIGYNGGGYGRVAGFPDAHQPPENKEHCIVLGRSTNIQTLSHKHTTHFSLPFLPPFLLPPFYLSSLPPSLLPLLPPSLPPLLPPSPTFPSHSLPRRS